MTGLGSDSARIHSLNKQNLTECPPCAKEPSGYSIEGGEHHSSSWNLRTPETVQEEFKNMIEFEVL